MAEILGFCPVISRSGPEKPLYGTKNRSQSPWNRPIWGAAREFDFRDEFAADSPLQRRVRELPISPALARLRRLARPKQVMDPADTHGYVPQSPRSPRSLSSGSAPKLSPNGADGQP